MSWVYKRTEQQLWTVGYYDQWHADQWHAESHHATERGAAARVHYLNGGGLSREEVQELVNDAIRAHTENTPHLYADGSSA